MQEVKSKRFAVCRENEHRERCKRCKREPRKQTEQTEYIRTQG